MKTTILVLVISTLAAAAPKVTKLHFRNLYKQPVGELTINPKPRIIGGQEAEPHSIPYQIFLEVYSKSGGWYCGGSLISRNYVLTAGHCGAGATEATVTLGAHKPLNIEDSQIQLVSTSITVNPNYDSDNIINDIAVIKLPQAVELTDMVQVATLPTRADANNDYVGATARVSGWGLTDGFGFELSDVLNYVDVEVITNSECEKNFGSLVDSIVCTSGKEETGSCSGDSGGPLVVNGVQIGVVSFGIVYCTTGYPSAYSRITSFLDWIESNTDVLIK